METALEQLFRKEHELQFVSCNEIAASQIGCILVERSQKERLPATIDITRAGLHLSHSSLHGTSSNNDEWIKRKIIWCRRSDMQLNPVISMLGRRLRLAVVGGGPGSFIGAMHRQAARLDEAEAIAARGIRKQADPLALTSRTHGLLRVRL